MSPLLSNLSMVTLPTNSRDGLRARSKQCVECGGVNPSHQPCMHHACCLPSELRDIESCQQCCSDQQEDLARPHGNLTIDEAV